ncbi:MAG TPA: GTP cyclohydrolase I FolE [Mycobacterium sp.]|nr:GTP cyclohydrolase I FolE [Mycobacterium sp.]
MTCTSTARSVRWPHMGQRLVDRRARAHTAASDGLRPTSPPLAVVSGVDVVRAQAAVRELLLAVGEDPQRQGLRDTPARVARAYQEILAGQHIDPANVLEMTFEEGQNELVLVKNIPLYSVCEHHLVPWHGSAAVGYVPASIGRVVGLSKLARLVDLCAKRLQLQERLTAQVADAVHSRLEAAGVIVVVRAHHLCMAMRGIRKPGTITVTSAVRGIFTTDGSARADAMTLILGP